MIENRLTMEIIEYTEEFGPVSYPEGFEACLEGLTIEEQLKYFRLGNGLYLNPFLQLCVFNKICHFKIDLRRSQHLNKACCEFSTATPEFKAKACLRGNMQFYRTHFCKKGDI